MPASRLVTAALCLSLAASCNCGSGRLRFAGGGTLHITLISAHARATALQVVLEGSAAEPLDEQVPIAGTPMETELPELAPGGYSARLVAKDAQGGPLQSVRVTDIEIRSKHVTEIIVDMAGGAGVPPPKDCSGAEPALCTACEAGAVKGLADDGRCGVIDCSGLDSFELRGDNTAAGESRCVKLEHASRVTGRCVAPGQCVAPNGPACTMKSETTRAGAGLCHTLSGCASGAPTVERSPDGTPCGGGRTCQAGVCTGTSMPEAGCADGTREGFTSQSSYPGIAGCSGGWSVPGVTRPALVPACGRAAGNSSANADGAGCSAADLCQPGWHVCSGKDEVAQKAGSCADAVPPGTPDKMLFFAVAQASQNNTTCGTSGDNDVFGCGNLGTELTPVRGCGVLTRALASTQAGSCGFNEAEPSLGPWLCQGGTDSHLHEGALVTKRGCPGGSCSYDGRPIGNADKGGVLCCRD